MYICSHIINFSEFMILPDTAKSQNCNIMPILNMIYRENKFQKVKVGADCHVRDGYRGFAQVFYDTAAKGDNARNMGYSVGLQRNISKNTFIRGVFRDNKTASVLYSNNFADSGICTKMACNFDFTKPPAERANLAWKMVFGCGSASSCCK